MADSLEYILTCQICMEEFEDSGDHVPRILPCHHTLCEKCLKQMIQTTPGRFVYCPECRKRHGAANMEKTFPQNKYILAFIHRKEAEHMKRELEIVPVICEKHGKEMILYCKEPECSTIICQTCLTRQHRGHDVVEIDEREKEVLLEKIDAVTKGLRKRKENILEAMEETDNKNRECVDKIKAQKDELIQTINQTCDQLFADMNSKSKNNDTSNKLTLIEEHLGLLSNIKENMDIETITHQDIKDDIKTVNSTEENIQHYSLDLSDCTFFKFEENENISSVVQRLCIYLKESVRQIKLSDVRPKFPSDCTVAMSLNTKVRDIWSISPVEDGVVLLTYESDGSSKLIKFDGTRGEMLQTVELGDGARKVTRFTLKNRSCVAVSYELENRIEFRDANDLNMIVLEYSVAPHCPWEMCASSNTTLWYQSYTELRQLNCYSSEYLTPYAIRQLATEEIIADMCCVEVEGKSLLVTASGIEGIKAYNTSTKHLEWSAAGRYTGMKETLDAHSIAADRCGHFFVCDTGNHCIHAFSMDGKYLTTIIRQGQQGLGKPRRIRWSEDLTGFIVTHQKDNNAWISLIKMQT